MKRQMLKSKTHRKGKIMNTELMLSMLNEIANQTMPDTSEIRKAINQCECKKLTIKRYSTRYEVARAKGKRVGTHYFDTNTTDKAYWTLRKNLAKLLPECKDTDGQIGSSFYLDTCPEKGEFVKITITRCNGVQAGSKTFTETVAEAKEYAELEAKISRLEKMEKSITNVANLAKRLAQTIKDLQEFK